MDSPEVKIVNGSLLVSHVDVVGEQIDRCGCPPLKDFMEGRETVALVILLQCILGLSHVSCWHYEPLFVRRNRLPDPQKSEILNIGLKSKLLS